MSNYRVMQWQPGGPFQVQRRGLLWGWNDILHWFSSRDAAVAYCMEAEARAARRLAQVYP